MVSNSQYTVPSQSSLQKGTGGKSQLCSKQSSTGSFPKNFLTISGYFECYMYRVMALGWLKKEKKEKKKNNSDIRPFQVCNFKIVTTHCYYYTADWGKLYAARCTFRHNAFVPW